MDNCSTNVGLMGIKVMGAVGGIDNDSRASWPICIMALLFDDAFDLGLGVHFSTNW